MEQLLSVLGGLFPDIDFAGERALIDEHVLDSMDILMLVGELNETYGVKITAKHLRSENFNSAEGILALLQALGA
ncbi:MAG: acyl carrier protein [Oscillospiraceae bacterium]|jgi:acyl carrier protein|nr:acyl carrier protein [Oscillospiraceae bacterium]